MGKITDIHPTTFITVVVIGAFVFGTAVTLMTRPKLTQPSKVNTTFSYMQPASIQAFEGTEFVIASDGNVICQVKKKKK